jgi:hypothetical protein
MDIKRNVITTSTKTREIPIPKKNVNSEIYNEQYDLKKNCFDPDKSSPPNSWTSRLLERIENYSGNNKIEKETNFTFLYLH